MLIFDQLRKDDPQLRMVALAVLAGLGVLLGGLWWVQVVSAREYRESLETQSFRTVRIPAVRGKILDANGAVLAENRPTYNLSLYLEELRKPFDKAYFKAVAQSRAELKQQVAEKEQQLGRPLTKQERKQFGLGVDQKNLLREKARYEVASNVVAEVSQKIGQPLSLDPVKFERHYDTSLAFPYPVVENLDPKLIACFEEKMTSPLGVDLEIQSTRAYPYQTTAAHVLGSLQRDNSSSEGEEAFFSYRLPDYRGRVGVEFGFDKFLRGQAGAKAVLVNNLGYRQTENVWSPAEAGHNVVLTLDLGLQQAAESALKAAKASTYSPVRGAVVVMDVQSGDILAMASAPTLNPNVFVQGLTHAEWDRISSLHAEKNRATQENYPPGSIFKTIVGMAALEAGLNPKRIFEIAADPLKPTKGVIYVGRQRFPDTAPNGKFDFRRAFKLSSNSYFITNGLLTGVENIVRLGQRAHLGERCGLTTRQETAGSFPSLERVRRANWHDGDTGNLCIGQGEIDVTPLQMAVLVSAIANGGKILWPRLVSRIEPQDSTSGEPPTLFPAGRVRDQLGVRPQTLAVVREAMLADTEDADGTGKDARVEGLRIGGKTGTAQKKNAQGKLEEHITWFASFAPYEKPRYAVVVMVEGGTSGGTTCAPVAHDVYAAIVEREKANAGKGAVVAQVNP